MRKRFLLSFLLFALSPEALQVPLHHFQKAHPAMKPPWFTGPLLAPSSITVPKGHYNIEPYLYVGPNRGVYTSDWKGKKAENFWNNYSQTTVAFGLSDFLDIQLNPTLFYNYSDGAAH